jgi:hypothetical protein
LYPFWRHGQLQTFLYLPPNLPFPPLRDFYPRHNWKIFFLSYFYHFGIWIIQTNAYHSFQMTFYPGPEVETLKSQGAYPSALTASVSDLVPTVMGLGVEIMLARGVAREAHPAGSIPGIRELGNLGLMVKALAAEWAAEWAWLEAQYWTHVLWCKYFDDTRGE